MKSITKLQLTSKQREQSFNNDYCNKSKGNKDDVENE